MLHKLKKIKLQKKDILSLSVAFVAALFSAGLAKWLLSSDPESIIMPSSQPSNIEPPKPIIVEKKIELPTARVLVANIEMPMGHVISAADLAWQKWPRDGVSEAHYAQDEKGDLINPQNRLDRLVGLMLKRPMRKGEPVTPSLLIRKQDRSLMSAMVSKGLRAVTVPIEAQTIQYNLFVPGDRVDVFAGDKSPVRINNVLVLALDAHMSSPNDSAAENAAKGVASNLIVTKPPNETAPPPSTVTLQVAPSHIEPLLKAVRESNGVLLGLRGFKENNEDEAAMPYLVVEKKEEEQDQQKQIVALLSELDKSIAIQKQMEHKINELDSQVQQREEEYLSLVKEEQRQAKLRVQAEQGRTIRIMRAESVSKVYVDANENIVSQDGSNPSASASPAATTAAAAPTTRTPVTPRPHPKGGPPLPADAGQIAMARKNMSAGG